MIEEEKKVGDEGAGLMTENGDLGEGLRETGGDRRKKNYDDPSSDSF